VLTARLRREDGVDPNLSGVGRGFCGRALKRAVLHRENALFYRRTLHGAEVGDLFMTLIQTCQVCGANPRCNSGFAFEARAPSPSMADSTS
jgi:hypothetical protein